MFMDLFEQQHYFRLPDPTWWHCNQHFATLGTEIIQCLDMSYSGDLGYAFCIEVKINFKIILRYTY